MVSGHTSLGGMFPLNSEAKIFREMHLRLTGKGEGGKVNEMKTNLVVWKGVDRPRERLQEGFSEIGLWYTLAEMPRSVGFGQAHEITC